jgi:dCMP deaminase
MTLKKCNRWDARFFVMCDMIASWSEDTSRKVGSVVVGPSNEIRSTGYNGFPRGVDSSLTERHDGASGDKYLWFEHAERNAIYNAAGSGAATAGCRMYVNSYPCADCARAIIQSGIVQLSTFEFDPTDDKFGQHFIVSEQMLQEAGIEVRFFDRNDEAISDQIERYEDARRPANRLIR